MKIIRDGIQLCPDCMIAAVNGDFTGLDNANRWRCLTCSEEGYCAQGGVAPTHCPVCTSEHDDNHGPHTTANLRMAAIVAGLERLGPNLVPAFDSETGKGYNEFSSQCCDCCREPHAAGARYEFAELGADDLLRDDERAALQRYANARGRTWKSQLSLDWSTGHDELEDDCGELRRVRNRLGPSWLMRKCKIRPAAKLAK